MGLANLFADGLSMGTGSYLGARSEADYHRQERERESWEIEHYPEGEMEEIREIYRDKGFEGEALEQAVAVITADKERWVRTMMVEELGIIEERKNPIRVGLTTFIAFLIAGAIPLISYMGALQIAALSAIPFQVAVVVTLVTIFGLGCARSLIIYKKWYVAGLEMLAVGGITAAVAYGIGAILAVMGVGA
jgi:VIT1/CCC1 family predicted Fe2+/Mn2+ transporter